MKKIVFILMILICWVIGKGQTTTIEINNITGISSICQSEMENFAGELKAMMEIGGPTVKLFLTKVYPTSAHMKTQDGLNAMEKLSKESVESMGENHIHFIAKVQENTQLSKLTIFWNLSENNMGNACYDKISFLKEYIQKNIDTEILKNPSISNLDCVVSNALKDLIVRLSSDCNMNAFERKAWFEANEFEFHELKGMQLDYGSNAGRRKGFNKAARSLCTIVDYTLGELTYILSNGGLRQINALLAEIPINTERRLIITDKLVSEKLCDSIMVNEMQNPSCEVVIWLHFGDTFQGGKDEVGVRIARLNAPGTSDSYTYEQLEAQYKLKDTGIFSGIGSLDFRLKNYKSEVIAMINSDQYSDYIPKQIITKTEYYAGLVSGFVDGAIESIDLLYLAGQVTYNGNSSLNPVSAAWWSDLIINANKKRNFYEAYKEKWSETFDNWITLHENVVAMYNAFSNEVIRAEIWRNFNIIFQKAFSNGSKSFKDWGNTILFVNENYDVGYARGKLAFDLVPAGWLFSAGKGAVGLAKVSKNMVGEIAENFGKSMDGITARNVLKESIVDLTELAGRLASRPKLKAWFDLDMPALVKVELGKHIDDADFLNKLDIDLGNSKWTQDIKDLITTKPTDLTDKYKLLKDDPGKAWDVAKEDPQWQNWSKKEFFKEVTQKGKNFEIQTCLPSLSNRLNSHYLNLKNQIASDFGKNLDDFDMFSQVQLNYGSNYFVADQVFVKFSALGDIQDIIVIENKLNFNTNLTNNQNAAKSISSYTVRSNQVVSRMGTTNLLSSGDVIGFNDQIKWYKVWDSDNGDVITGIQKI